VLAVVPTTGSIRDWSKFDNDIAITGNCYWNGWRDKWGIFTDKATGAIDCGDFSGVDFSNGFSAFASFHLNTLTGPNLQNIIGGNPGFSFDISNNLIRVFSNALADTIIIGTTILQEDRHYTIAFTYDGDKKIYLDGAEEASESATGTIVLTNVELLRFNNSLGRYLHGGVHSVILCQNCFDSNDVGIINDWQQNLNSPRFRWQGVDWCSPIDSSDPNLIGAWDCGFIDQLVCEDRSGNSNDGLVSGAVHPYISPIGRASRFDGESGKIETTLVDLNDNGITLEIVSRKCLNPTTFVNVFGQENIHYSIATTSAGNYYFQLRLDTGVKSTGVYAIDDKWHHIIARWENGEKLQLIVDNVLVTESASGASGVLNQTSNNINFSYYVTLSSYLCQSSKYGKIYNYRLTDNEIKQKYNEFAKTPTLIAPIGYSPESLTDEGGEQHIRIGDTEFHCSDSIGRWQVVRDDDVKEGRATECQVGGDTYTPCNLAYGTWDFYLKKGSESTDPQINIISNNFTSVGSGYFLRLTSLEEIQLNRTGAAVLFKTAAGYIENSVWYHFIITRKTNDGEIAVYIKGGNFENWTLVDTTGGTGTNPVVDNNITTSKNIVYNLEPLDKFGITKKYAGAVAL
jgi:hypothetical protein